MKIETVEKILKEYVNSAVLIDDEAQEPYTPKLDVDNGTDWKELYGQFGDSLRCDIRPYKFSSKEQFQQDKANLFHHRQLMVLDWELSQILQVKYVDALTILRDAVDDNFIRVVVIYTNSEDTTAITLKSLGYLKGIAKNVETDKIVEEISQKLNDMNSDKVDEFIGKVNANASGFALLKSENRGAIIQQVCSDFHNFAGNTKCSLSTITSGKWKYPMEFMEWLDCYNNGVEKAGSLPVKPYNVEVVSDKCLLVEGTAIMVISKQEVKPENLIENIAKIILRLPNKVALCLSMLFCNNFNRQLAVIGKGIGGFQDDIILDHLSKYKEEEDKYQFVYRIVNEQIYSLSIEEDQKLLNDLIYAPKKEAKKEHNKENKEKNPKIDARLEKLLSNANEFLMFDKRKSIGNLHTGDLFKVENCSLLDNPHTCFLMCISQACDCLRPQKINHNYSFAIGEVSYDKDFFVNIEKEYSSVCCGNRLKWLPRFFTINIPSTIDLGGNQIEIKLNKKSFDMEYLGRLKPFYAQRIANYVFSYAMRMGIDVPHIDEPDEEETKDK